MTQKDNIRKRTRVGVRNTGFGPRSIIYEPFKLEQVILPAELVFFLLCNKLPQILWLNRTPNCKI